MVPIRCAPWNGAHRDADISNLLAVYLHRRRKFNRRSLLLMVTVCLRTIATSQSNNETTYGAQRNLRHRSSQQR